MFGWLVRLILLASGTIAGCIVVQDAPNFGVIQAMIGVLLIALIVFVLAFWPARWSRMIDRASGKAE
jgi:hypothetical protein